MFGLFIILSLGVMVCDAINTKKIQEQFNMIEE